MNKKTICSILGVGLLFSGIKIGTALYSIGKNINSYLNQPEITRISNNKILQKKQVKKRKSLWDLKNKPSDTTGTELNLNHLLKEIIWQRGYDTLDDAMIDNETINYPFEIMNEDDEDKELGDDCFGQCIYIETDDPGLKYAKIDVPTGTQFPIRLCYQKMFPYCDIISYKLEQTILILTIDSENNLIVDYDGFKFTKFNQSGLQIEDYYTIYKDIPESWKEIK
jgi:hypothetical protein